MNRKLLLVLLVSGSASAMGRLPDDPATWGDVQDARGYTYSLNAEQRAVVNGISSNSIARDTAINDRIDDLEKPKAIIDTSVRVFDTKRVTGEVFNQFDASQGNEFAYGVRLKLKLGSSYEERLIRKQQQELEALRAIMDKITP